MDSVLRFSRLVSVPDGRLDVFTAAVAIAGVPGERPDFAACSRQIDDLALGVDSIDSLRSRLFEQAGFRGDLDDYDAPHNSFLPVVLQRRRGLPIALAVVTVEVARRAGLDVRILGMPGHALVRHGEDGVIFDPFFGGEILDFDGCERRFREVNAAGDQVAFTSELLAELPPLAILTRMIDNLISAYRRQQRPRELERVLRMRRALPGFHLDHLLALGEAIAAQGHHETAVAELETAAYRAPSHLAAALRAGAAALRERLNI